MKPVLICFAGDRWDGNPHSRHHLMRRYAGEFEVLFIESLPMRSIASVDRGELGRAWRKLRTGIAAGARIRTMQPGLHVLSALPIPPAGRAGHALQLAAMRGQIALARRRLRLGGPAVTWFSVPVAAPLRGRLSDRGSIFYYQDRYDEFSGVNAVKLRELTDSLARGCEVTVATSRELADDLVVLGAQPLLVPHGVDLDRFAGDPPAPADLSALEKPLVGYVGILDDYLSFAAIRETAQTLERRGSGTVVLIGGTNADLSELDHPRIERLGFRPYDAIPAYLNAFDCCIAPFQMTRLTMAVNPIKLREYLAAGRPVVSAPLPAVVEYGDVVELAASPAEFAGAVVRVLDSEVDSDDDRARRRARVAGDSWDAVADRIRPILHRLAGSSEDRLST